MSPMLLFSAVLITLVLIWLVPYVGEMFMWMGK